MKYYSVVFSPYTGTKTYTYKTDLELKKNDLAVVCTPGGLYQVVRVVQEVSPPVFECKRIVQIVDLTEYKAGLIEDKQDKQDETKKLERL